MPIGIRPHGRTDDRGAGRLISPKTTLNRDRRVERLVRREGDRFEFDLPPLSGLLCFTPGCKLRTANRRYGSVTLSASIETYGKRMHRLFRRKHKRRRSLGDLRKTFGGWSARWSWPILFQPLEETWDEGIKELAMPRRVRMFIVKVEAGGVSSRPVVRGPQEVHGWHVPGILEQVHLADIFVIDRNVDHPKIDEPDNGHNIVLSRAADETLNAGGILIEDGVLFFLCFRLRYAFVGKRQTDHDIAGINRQQIQIGRAHV